MESIDSFMRLELSFLPPPSTKISTSLVAPDGTKMIQSSFEGLDCPKEWITALRAMVDATKSANGAGPCHVTPADVNRSSELTSAVTLNSRQARTRLGRHRCTPSRSQSRSRASRPRTSERRAFPLSIASSPAAEVTTAPFDEDVNDLNAGWPSAEEDIRGYWYNFDDAMNNVVTDVMPASERAPSSVHAYRVSAPAALRGNEGCGSGNTRPAFSSVELQAGSPNVAIDQEPNSSAMTSATAMDKRMQKLEERLKAIRDGSLPDKDEFNDTVRRLYQNSSASQQPIASMEHFGYILGRLGNVSSAVGIIYSLLSWEIFRWEEDKLIHHDGLALLMAAKQINEKMAEMSNRRAKTKDWASDGRRAAGMVFESIANLSPSAQSFALIVLAGNVTLDGLLRIAHFPSLREHFRVRFAQIVESQYTEWEDMAANHAYMIFDYKEFLRRGVLSSGTRNSNVLSNQETPTYGVHPLSPRFETSNMINVNMAYC